jgi:mono/diheme cytochrome c family protein
MTDPTVGAQFIAPGRDKSRPYKLLLFLIVIAFVACRQDMHDQPKYIPLRQSTFFEDGRSERPLVEGTVPQGPLRDDSPYYTGKSPDGKLITTFPVKVDEALLERGQERFNIFCSPCHDRLGTGQGVVVRRGYRRPPSFHIDRLRAAPPGHFFDVMTNGFGAMPKYSVQVPVEDRWAIVAYIRVLQYSQRAPLADVPEAERSNLK